MKVLIINSSVEYDKLFSSLGYDIVYDVSDADLICFTGGADVSPELYDHTKHPKTHNHPQRDEVEQVYYEEALEAGVPMVGICRGAQFLHVMNGGSMFQHVDGHATGKPHELLDLVTNERHLVTSTHHQMMIDNVEGSVLVGIASESTVRETGEEADRGEHADVEVLWHPNTKCLCFQPHPEFNWAIGSAEYTYFYFKNLLQRYLGENYAN